MTINEILGSLNNYTTVKNTELASLAANAVDLTVKVNNKEISVTEYNELLHDLMLEKIIINDADELNTQQVIHDLIETAITLTSMMATL